MKGLKLLLPLLLISLLGYSQTTAWSTSPAVTSQTRTFSGSPQIRWLFGTHLYSVQDSILKYVGGVPDSSIFATRYWAHQNFVPYTGAASDVNLGVHNLFAGGLLIGTTDFTNGKLGYSDSTADATAASIWVQQKNSKSYGNLDLYNNLSKYFEFSISGSATTGSSPNLASITTSADSLNISDPFGPVYIGPSNYTRFNLNGTVQASGNFHSLYNARSYPDKGYVDSVASGGGSSFYQTVKNQGTGLTQRANLNFAYGLVASDGSPNTNVKVDSTALKSKAGALADYNVLITALAGKQPSGTYLTPSSTNTVTNKDLTSGTNTFPTFNQNTTGQSGSVANSLTNGYGITTLTYNGSSAKSVVADTSALATKVYVNNFSTKADTTIFARKSGSTFTGDNYHGTHFDYYKDGSGTSLARIGAGIILQNTSTGTQVGMDGGGITLSLSTQSLGLGYSGITQHNNSFAGNIGFPTTLTKNVTWAYPANLISFSDTVTMLAKDILGGSQNAYFRSLKLRQPGTGISTDSVAVFHGGLLKMVAQSSIGGSTYTNGYGLNLSSLTFSLDTAGTHGAVSKDRAAANYATLTGLAGKESTSNKVTTLDNSATHYPSTSALYSVIGAKQPRILGSKPTATNTTYLTTDSVSQVLSNLNNGILNSTPQKNYYGYIVNQTTFSSTAGYTNNGATVTATGGVLQFSSGVTDMGHTLDLTYNTSLEKWKQHMTYIVPTVSGTSYGLVLSMRSNSVGATLTCNAQAGISTATGDGHMYINYSESSTATQAAISPTALTFTAGDVIDVTFERIGNILIATGYNVTTKSLPVIATYTYPTFAPVVAAMPNAGRFGIANYGGTVNLTSYSVYSGETSRCDILIIGDSKTVGYDASFLAYRYAALLGRKLNIVVLAGTGDKITDVQLHIAEIIALNPKNIIFCIGSNDVRAGTTQSTINTNYDAMVASIASGLPSTNLYHMLPLYENSGIDQSGNKSHILATYSAGSIIDTKLETYAGTASNVLGSDNIHPNDLGHKIIADATLATGYFTNYVNTNGPTFETLTISNGASTSFPSLSILNDNALKNNTSGLLIGLNGSGTAASDLAFINNLRPGSLLLATNNVSGITIGTTGAVQFNQYNAAGFLATDASGNISVTPFNLLAVSNTTLVSGTKAITVSGVTSLSHAFVTLVAQGGTSTTVYAYKAVCTTNTVTITAETVAGVAVTTDTSILNYQVYK